MTPQNCVLVSVRGAIITECRANMKDERLFESVLLFERRLKCDLCGWKVEDELALLFVNVTLA